MKHVKTTGLNHVAIPVFDHIMIISSPNRDPKAAKHHDDQLQLFARKITLVDNVRRSRNLNHCRVFIIDKVSYLRLKLPLIRTIQTTLLHPNSSQFLLQLSNSLTPQYSLLCFHIFYSSRTHLNDYECTVLYPSIKLIADRILIT